MPHPHFEFKAADRTQSENDEEDEIADKYQKEFAENKALFLEPAKDHPDYKWVIMWEGYKTFLDYRRRANYCNPDNFGMYIYNDFEGWGLQELMENQVGQA